MEEWRPIEGFRGYEISSLGRIRRYRILTAHPDVDGYPRIQLQRDNGKHIRRPLHRLVLFAFAGPPPPNCVASHLDGDRANARAENLVWETQRENIARKREHGTEQIGEKANNVKLTTEDVVEIRRRHEFGESKTALASAFSVTRANIRSIVLRKTWRHI